MALLQIFLTTVLLAALLTIGGAIRRLFLHPLAHIPGPRLAALTWWYEFYFDAIQPGQYVFKIQELHKRYGPIIRVTPDEIHISDVGFLDTIYAPSSSSRDKYEYQLRSLRVPGGVGTTPSLDVHRKRREALSPFFSKRNVLFLEPTITEKVQQLCQLLLKHASEQTPVNLSDVFFAFSNDVVNNFLFSQRTDILSDEQKAATLRHNSYKLMIGIHLNKHFPFIPDFLESLPKSISRPIMPPGLLDMLDLFDRVRAELVGIIKAKASGAGSDSSSAKSVYYNVLDNPILPAPEKALLRLEQEGALLVLAGTESPAKSLNMIFYHLLANAQIMSKLREELSTIARPASWTQLERLPYLTAVIEEAHRLSFGVTARTARIARETLIYTPTSYAAHSSNIGKSFRIPAGTPMSTTTLSAHTAPSVFPDPFVFDPERWLGEKGRKLQKYQMSFGKGSRKCLGIELARAEMYLVTAALVQGFDMNLWKTEASDVAFVHDYHVSMPSIEFKGLEATMTALIVRQIPRGKVIGYYESWSYTSECNQKSPSDRPLSELTHLNYAIAYIDPDTYELTTMDSTTPEDLFQLTVDAKEYNPALSVFVSVGGWTFSDNDTVTQPLFRAPDRGGKDEDTDNFVSLIKALRTTFNASPRSLGLSFTTPSSYWYLKWFDLPNLLKYADWTNLMSYDLHGTWDRNNPIGASHTNLTEIQSAVALFWRVGIKPEQIVMGFGFYGRSFQLSDPSCSTPGCAFSGGGDAGPCSATSGILMYYEIQAILNQVDGLEPVYDEDAAVKYLVFDDDQWVSYDDADAFGDKLAWANAIGIGGSLIWAVDTDDDNFPAMSALLGEEVSHVDTTTISPSVKTLAVTESSVVSTLVGQNGQDCSFMKSYSCAHKDKLRCESGYTLVGWDRDGCSDGNYGKPICCPEATAPSNCQWRGGGGDCNGQYHTGESTVLTSSWCTLLIPETGAVATHRKAAPDHVVEESKPSVAKRATGKMSSQDADGPADACGEDTEDDWGVPLKRDLSLVQYQSSPDAEDLALVKRGSRRPFKWYTLAGQLVTQYSRTYPSGTQYMRNLRLSLANLSSRWWQMRSTSCDDPSVTATDIGSTTTSPATGQVEHVLPVRSSTSYHAHPSWCTKRAANVDLYPQLFVLTRFASVTAHGQQWRQVVVTTRRNTTPDGPVTRTSQVSETFWQDVWDNDEALPSGLPRVSSSSPDLRNPAQRLYKRMGCLETFQRTMAPAQIAMHAMNALDATNENQWLDIQAMFTGLRETIGVFEYINHEDVITRLDTVSAGIYSDLQIIEANTEGSDGLSAHWNEFYPYYFGQFEASNSEYRDYVLSELQKIEDKIRDLKYPFED
ncbi:putative cytochrome p450 protein [Seiridium unicorne]|uniref:chitinase n=1 Tax=Seiridium unicorne TaxID=138068 RepID=A0ABR2V9J7_9PEZI